MHGIKDKLKLKFKQLPIVRWVVVLTFWSIICGWTVYKVFDAYEPVKIAGLVFFCIGMTVFALCFLAGLVLLVKMLIDGIKALPDKRRFSAGAERKRNKKLSEKKPGKKIRVGFYVDAGQFFSTYADLYDSLKNDDRFETVMMTAPEMYKNEVYSNDAPEFLEKLGIPYVNLYENGSFKKLSSLNLDYCFYNRHYLARQPKQVSFLEARKDCRICYIAYALCPQTGQVESTLCNFTEMRGFDYLFAENRLMADIYEKYKMRIEGVNTKILPVGSPKFAYAMKHADKSASHDKKYVQSILYTPRWRFSENTSSFFLMKDYFFRLVEENKDIEYVFRPHPLMKQNVIETIGEEFWNEFADSFDKYENASMDTELDYMDSFSRASVLVSDVSTMMFEFATTGKPVIYMYRREILNAFGKEAAKGYYVCSSPDDVDRVLKDLRNGKDEKAELRQEIAHSLYNYGDADPSEQIKNILLNGTEE